MKFLKSEHESVKQCIKKAGLVYDDFSFVKRKGRLYISFKQSEPGFSFFRRKEIKLEGNGFVENTQYDIRFDGNKNITESWSDVLTLFSSWLSSLS